MGKRTTPKATEIQAKQSQAAAILRALADHCAKGPFVATEGSIDTRPFVLTHLADALDALGEGTVYPILQPAKAQGRRRDQENVQKATLAGWAQHLVDCHQLGKTNAADFIALWSGVAPGLSAAKTKAGVDGRAVSNWMGTYAATSDPHYQRAFNAAAAGQIGLDGLHEILVREGKAAARAARTTPEFENAVRAEVAKWRDAGVTI